MADGDCVSPDITFGPYLAEYNWDNVAAEFKPAEAPTGWFSIGLIEGAARLNRQHAGEDITATQFGDSVIDTVYTGANIFYTLAAKEWTTNNKRLLWPWGADQGSVGPIGASMCDAAGALRLTPQAGSKASSGAGTLIHGGAFLFRRAILSADLNQELLFGNTPRDTTLTFRCYPYELSGPVYSWYEYFFDSASIPTWPV